MLYTAFTALPALHPAYGKLTSFNAWNIESSVIHIAIPTEPQGGNHTPAFAKAAISEAAHDAAMVVTKALALTGYRVLSDFDFFRKVKASSSLLTIFLLTYTVIPGARFIWA